MAYPSIATWFIQPPGVGNCGNAALGRNRNLSGVAAQPPTFFHKAMIAAIARIDHPHPVSLSIGQTGAGFSPLAVKLHRARLSHSNAYVFSTLKGTQGLS